MELKTIESTDKANVVSLSGHMGFEAAQGIEKKLKEATSGKRKSAIIDLSELTFISSFGVRLFLDILQAQEKHHHKLFLVNPQESVREVLVGCEMDTLAGIYDTKEKALAAL
jgi:anti-anti-sigma factor